MGGRSVLHGGIIGGVIATYLYFKSKPIPMVEILDAFGLAIAPGIILVRFGNYMNGDILGYKTDLPWAMNFPLDSYHIQGSMFYEGTDIVLRHPAELYGMAVGLICLVITIYLWDKTYIVGRFHKGIVAWGMIFSYSLVRSIIEEPFRAVPLPWKVVDPATAGYGLFTTTQIASFFLIVLSLWAFSQLGAWDKKRAFASSPASVKQKPAPGSAVSRQARRAAERQSKKES